MAQYFTKFSIHFLALSFLYGISLTINAESTVNARLNNISTHNFIESHNAHEGEDFEVWTMTYCHPQHRNDDIVEQPDYTKRIVHFLFENGNVYLGNLDDNTPDCWLEGYIENNKIIFPKGQHFYHTPDGLSHTLPVYTKSEEDIYFVPAEMWLTRTYPDPPQNHSNYGNKINRLPSVEGELLFIVQPTDKDLTFDYDPEAGIISNPSSDFLFDYGTPADRWSVDLIEYSYIKPNVGTYCDISFEKGVKGIVSNPVAFQYNDINYKIVNEEEKTCEVSTNTFPEEKNLIIPETVEYDSESYTVIGIGKEAFINSEEISTIQLPNTITYIGESAFEYSDLESIEIPNSVTTIGDLAFSRCYNLVSVKLPNSITAINFGTFRSSNKLRSIEIPPTVEVIEEQAFANTGISSIEIPYSVTAIEAGAFRNCVLLKSIDIPGSVQHIGSNAFADCTLLSAINVAEDNPNYKSIDGTLYSKDCTTLIRCPGAHVGEYVIPNFVATIFSYAFSHCAGLTTINIPNSVTSIGAGAFSYCEQISSFEIPESIDIIAANTFSGCTNLSSLKIPATIKEIGANAFSYCKKMTSFEIPAGITKIEKSTFYGSGLKSIIIPESITLIEEGALMSDELRSITCLPQTPPAISGGSFDKNTFYFAKLYIREGLLDVYRSNTRWNEFRRIMYIGQDFSEDGIDYSIINKDEKTCLTIGLDIEYFNDSEKWDIIIPSEVKNNEVYFKVTGIGAGAFADCNELNTITLPNTLTVINTNAFKGCSGLSSIEFPASLQYIDHRAFHNCDNLRDVTCYATTPPEIILTTFDLDTYINGSLYVPEDSMDYYTSAIGWKNFNRIMKISSDVSEISDNDNNALEVFAINGTRIGIKDRNQLNELPSGLYIIKYSNRMEKLRIR